MNAMTVSTNNESIEISPRITFIQMGTINASMNAGSSELRVQCPSEEVIGLMPGPMLWHVYGSEIVITNVSQFFDTSKAGTSFTFEVGVRIDDTTTGIYTVIVKVI